ncbi:MAG: ATP-binding cassette domain-containing protein [Nitrospiria bacterium]
MNSPAVTVQNLVKRYGALAAVEDISFEVAAGTCFGSLGPNGAGKTTLIRILSGLIRPSAGQAFVNGLDVAKRPDAVRRGIGVVSQAMTTDLDLTGRENLDIYARYYNVPLKARKSRIDSLLERVGLTDRANDLVATYSGGMRRRLEIARGLIHRPSILFLDEPTIGLDPQSRRVVWDLLQEFRRDEHLTIFLTTHYMDEADILCDRIAIIDHGKIIILDTPEGLKKGIPGQNSVEAVIEHRPDFPAPPESANPVETLIARLSGHDFVRDISHEPSETLSEQTRLHVSVTNGVAAIPVLINTLQECGFNIHAVGLKQASLEEVFIHYTGRSIRREEGQKVNFFIGAGVPRKMGN